MYNEIAATNDLQMYRKIFHKTDDFTHLLTEFRGI